MRFNSIKPFASILLISLICVTTIVVYGTFRCKHTAFVDPLTYSFAPPPFDRYLDGWGLTHLLFYGMLGYLYPDPHLVGFCFVLGVLWEVVEYSLKDKQVYVSKCKYRVNAKNQSGWWYGRYQDIVMNTFGLLAGVAIAKKLKA